MNANEKNRFYLLWTLAIFLCTALAVFVLFYTSFTSPKESSAEETPYTQSEPSSLEASTTEP